MAWTRNPDKLTRVLKQTYSPHIVHKPVFGQKGTNRALMLDPLSLVHPEGGQGARTGATQRNHKLLYVSLEYWYGPPSRSNWTRPIASQGRSVRPSVKHVDD